MADSVVISHIIGTSALLVMFFVVGSYYDGFYTNLNREAYSAQVGQVANHFSEYFMDLVTLAQLTEADQFLLKTVEAPPFIGGRLYNISMVTMTPGYGDDEIMRVLASIDALGIYSTSDLPWSIDSNIALYTNQTLPNKPSDVILLTRLQSDAAISRAAQTEGCAKMIIWCSKISGNMTIGLGLMDLGGG